MAPDADAIVATRICGVSICMIARVMAPTKQTRQSKPRIPITIRVVTTSIYPPIGENFDRLRYDKQKPILYLIKSKSQAILDATLGKFPKYFSVIFLRNLDRTRTSERNHARSHLPRNLCCIRECHRVIRIKDLTRITVNRRCRNRNRP